jgi:DNA polymerase-3 subunit gamma/tau
MEYKAIYRQWRPATFDELLGQEAITNTIKNALLTGKVSHAYLFTGSRGTGKTSTAKLIAKALNCLDRNGANPCGKCDSCISIDKGSFMDVLEIDGASNRGIDEIRELKEKLAYAPSEGKYKVYIIDEVHMLTNEAFNALLKTLEEPPDRVVFILATTEPQKLPATIRSRCQRYDFKRATTIDIKKRIEEILSSLHKAWEDEALHYIAIKGDGSFRDALSILDQCISSNGLGLTLDRVNDVLGSPQWDDLFNMAYLIHRRDSSSLIKKVDALIKDGKDEKQLLESLINHFRNLMILKLNGAEDLIDLPLEITNKLKEQASQIPLERIMFVLEKLNEGLKSSMLSSSPRLAVEYLFIQLTREELDGATSAILSRLSRLEELINNNAFNTKELNTTSQGNTLEGKKRETKKKSTVEESGVNNNPTTVKIENDILVKWKDVINLCINNNSPGLKSIVNYVKPVKINGSVFHIGFDDNFYKDLFTKGNYRDTIGKYINQVYHGEFEISLNEPRNEGLKIAERNKDVTPLDLKNKVMKDFPGVKFEIIEE